MITKASSHFPIKKIRKRPRENDLVGYLLKDKIEIRKYKSMFFANTHIISSYTWIIFDTNFFHE